MKVPVRTIQNFFNSPTVSVAEALGFPQKRRLSLDGIVKEVNFLVYEL